MNECAGGRSLGFSGAEVHKVAGDVRNVVEHSAIAHAILQQHVGLDGGIEVQGDVEGRVLLHLRRTFKEERERQSHDQCDQPHGCALEPLQCHIQSPLIARRLEWPPNRREQRWDRERLLAVKGFCVRRGTGL
jgi:hypothetical protein